MQAVVKTPRIKINLQGDILLLVQSFSGVAQSRFARLLLNYCEQTNFTALKLYDFFKGRFHGPRIFDLGNRPLKIEPVRDFDPATGWGFSSGHPGNMKEIADYLGIHYTTVSKAIKYAGENGYLMGDNHIKGTSEV